MTDNFLKGIDSPTARSAEKHKLDFTEVYEKNLFESGESVSGVGSELNNTIVIRRELQEIINNLSIKSFLDLPCGDFNWMQHVDFEKTNYIGGDIVDSLITSNNIKYKNNLRSFFYIDLTKSYLPEVDAVFCRDCIVHLNFEQAFNAIKNIKASGSKYLLTTTFINRNENIDLDSGIWRTLNLQLPPFYFPEPIKLINEECTEGDGHFNDKCIGVWAIDDLPDFD